MHRVREFALALCEFKFQAFATCTAAGAEVTLESGEKLRGRFVVLADGVHSQTAAKYHKAQLEYMNDIGWR